MAFLQVQKKAYVNVTSSPATNAFGSNVTAGNLLLALVTSFGVAPSTPTDTQGNTWIQAGGTVAAGGTSYLFYAVAKSTGANTVSVAFASARLYLSVAEFSGAASTGQILDSTVTGTSSVGTSPVSNLYATAGNLLITLFGSSAGQTFSAFSGGLTAGQAVAGGEAAWGYNLSSSAGMNTGSCTLSVSDTCVGKTWSFLPATPASVIGLGFVRSSETSVKDVGSPPVSPAQISFAGGNTLGNTIIVYSSQFFATSNKITGITDTAGNIYTPLAGATIPSNGNSAWSQFYICSGCKAFVGTNQITAAFSGLADACEIFAAEFGGQAAFDAANNANVPVGLTLAYTITAAAAAELIVTNTSAIGGSVVANSGNSVWLTYFPNAPTVELAAFYLLPSTLGLNAITTTVTGSAVGLGSHSVALAPLFSISGNAGIAGVTVSYTGTVSGSVVADGSGNFVIPALPNGSYTITPSLAGETFSPANQSETVNAANIIGVNFTASKSSTNAGQGYGFNFGYKF